MDSVFEASLALVLMLAGAGIGIALRRALPDRLLDDQARDVVRLGAALVATITALVLGLLITSANTFFEAQRNEVRQIAADAILLDAMLNNFGPPALDARKVLRDSMSAFIDQVWNDGESKTASPLGHNAHSLFNAIASLPATTPLQRTMQDQGLATAIRLAQTRLSLFERSRSSLPTPIFVVLVFWLMALFASFSLFSRLNPASTAALALVAFCASAALLLILEMHRPFSGLMRVSPNALTAALPPL